VPVSGTSFSFSFGGVGYPEGWCTYYAAARSGAPGGWGNAATWAYYAALTPGWSVSPIPRKGAIAQTTANHVGIVEDVRIVNGQYQIKYSDMNGLAGFGRVGYSGWVSSTDPFQNYIYH
jgi:surface antigen